MMILFENLWCKHTLIIMLILFKIESPFVGMAMIKYQFYKNY